MKVSDDHYYMDVAYRSAQRSYCSRLKVGAVVVTDSGAMFAGYNGTIPKHFPNVCELDSGETAPYTVHAEENCLYKMLKEGVSPNGATLYISHGCCVNCSRMIACSGIKEVVYAEDYRSSQGLDILRQCEITVRKYQKESCNDEKKQTNGHGSEMGA